MLRSLSERSEEQQHKLEDLVKHREHAKKTLQTFKLCKDNLPFDEVRKENAYNRLLTIAGVLGDGFHEDCHRQKRSGHMSGYC